jgi:hypothetical protein
MSRLPKVIASSVVRSTRQGESHGGVYLVDLESGTYEQVIDWNESTISWEGRGGDRGLRGIAFGDAVIYLAASDEIFVYDRNFRLLDSYTNQFLKCCHEIVLADGVLYLTSTNLNSILEFDTRRHLFRCGHVIVREKAKLWQRSRYAYRAIHFDPEKRSDTIVKLMKNDLHINNVTRHNGLTMIAATQVDALLALDGERLCEYARLPLGTHNAAVYRDGVIYNDTRRDRVVIATEKINRTFDVPTYDPTELMNTQIPNDHARQRFARGLCLYGDEIVVAGSSPSTASAYEISSGERLQSVNLSKDIRNCIHGLEIWPE